MLQVKRDNTYPLEAYANLTPPCQEACLMEEAQSQGEGEESSSCDGVDERVGC